MTEDVDFIPRRTISHDFARLSLALRLTRDRLAAPLLPVVEWLARRLP